MHVFNAEQTRWKPEDDEQTIDTKLHWAWGEMDDPTISAALRLNLDPSLLMSEMCSIREDPKKMIQPRIVLDHLLLQKSHRGRFGMCGARYLMQTLSSKLKMRYL